MNPPPFPREGPQAPVLLVLVALSLFGGVAGGLLRAGIAWPVNGAGWPGHAALSHAALMICGFMGTVIGIERAVAVKLRAAWAAPLASGLGGLLLLGGQAAAGGGLLVAASVCFVGVNAVAVRHQRAAHTWLLLAGALAWLAGSLLFALGLDSAATLPWWFSFLVMTIAAQRLEMTRLMRRRSLARPLLLAVLAAMLAGAAWCALSPRWGGLLYGAALVLLALWLGVFDVARRTVRGHGLARYMAVCLLGGYFWLAVAGLAWAATALGLPARDAALHALGLGFIVSMMMGHAPVILPAVARIKLLFGPAFYLPLATLHLSLFVRLGLGATDPRLRGSGALFNAFAIVLFAATLAGAALAWRIRYGARSAREKIA